MERDHQLFGGAYSDAWSVAFSTDGGRLASRGEDGKNIIFDVVSGARLNTIDAPGGAHRAVFSPDGTRLLSGGVGGTFLWGDVDLQSWQSRARRAANRNLTHEEWNQFAGSGIPYSLTGPNFAAPEK